MRTDTAKRRLWLGVGVAALAAVVATGALGVSGSDKITTIAGTGKPGFSGDGGPATSAKLFVPRAVAVDGKGNAYVVDSLNNRVRRVSPGGTITTFAGTGKMGFSGDGGPATSATLRLPQLITQAALPGVAVDGRGNVYIADTFNNRVRRVSPGGTITTIAGCPDRSCPLGDGGPATSAQLYVPAGVAVDGGGNVYIADSLNHRVRKVSPNGMITTIAGTGRILTPRGDGGPATAANLDNPSGLAVDGQGNVYVTDAAGDSRVRKISAGGTITTIAGTAGPGKFGLTGFSGDGGPATSAKLNYPVGLAVDGEGSLYIADWQNSRVRKVSPGGTITTFAGGSNSGFSGDGGPAISAKLDHPWGVAVDGKGNVYIADTGNSRVRKVGGSASAAAALTLTLGGPTPQPLLNQKAITVTARCSGPCALAATGSVTILGTPNVFGLTRASASLAAAGSTKLTLRFSAVAQRQFRLFLKPGQRAQAKITVRATDTAGRSTTATRTVAIRSSRAGSSSGSSAELRTFVDRIEGVLAQSASGRRELGSAITAGFNCSISARAAGQRVDRVVENRQSLLSQLRGLPAPSAQAGDALALLRSALQHSIEADIRYRDGFFGVGASGCPLPPNRNFTLARQSDIRATAAKQRFVAVFNPLARSAGRRTWSANEI